MYIKLMCSQRKGGFLSYRIHKGLYRFCAFNAIPRNWIFFFLTGKRFDALLLLL